MGSNVSTQLSQAPQSWSCSLCRGLRPREWPANSTRSFVGEDIDLYWFPKDIALVRDPGQTCPFCCFVRAIVDHLCREGDHEWPTTVPIRGNTITNSIGKFSGYYSLTIELRPEYPLRNRDIDIFLDDPKKKLPWLEIKNLPPSPLRDPSSDAAVQWVKARLKKCLKKHNMCRPPKETRLPKRVVDLGKYPVVRLLETTGQENNEYACLSHRWGEGQVPATQTQNLATRLEEGIKWDEFPKLLQEAITLIHQLGTRYLWVASLCILQDNPEDQHEHSRQMGTIFSNAHITIAAVRVDNASQSLFSSGESSLTYNDIPLILRERPYHPTTYHSTLDMFPLLCRAWAAQEILLSRRMLYVCEGILTYECVDEKAGGWSCTCTDDPRDEHRCPGLKDPLMGVSLFAKPPPSNPFGPWWQVIEYYTNRDISDEKDRLPALSNIARHFAERQRGGQITYAAGLWVEDLPAGLLWHHRHNHSPKPRNSASTAPSWSWASTIGQAFSHHVDPTSDLYYVSIASVECFLLSYPCSKYDRDDYGLLQSGRLVLTGSCLLPFDLWHRAGTRHYKAVHAGKGGINVLPEIEIEYRDDGWDAGKEGEYYGMPMARISSEIGNIGGSSLGYTVVGLVLRRLQRNGQDNEFERVAFWECTSEKGYWGKDEDEWSGERLDRLLEGRQGEPVVIL